MSIYLHDIPLSTALKTLNDALLQHGLWRILETEDIPLNEKACGRVLAEAVWAKISSPHYHASAMDGFAVRASATQGAQPSAPVSLVIGSEAVYVDTGDALPDWANAVVPIEQVEILDHMGRVTSQRDADGSIRLRAALIPWNHVRPMGEDIVATQLILPSGHTISAVDLGAMAACGHTTVKVARKPRIGVIPTGTELVPIGQDIKKGDIIEYNSIVMAAMINAWGGEAVRYAIVPDDFEKISTMVKRAAHENDLVLLNAGSSAGSEDFSAKIVESLGELLVHGVAVRPGHPVILGILNETSINGLPKPTPIIGVPGYPVSAALTCEIFLQPLLNRWLGRQGYQQQEVEGTLVRKVTSPAGDDDFVRVVAGRVGEEIKVAPLQRGAGVIMSMVKADGLVLIPRGEQGYAAGTKVKIRLYRHPKELENTILAIGSHDITLDLLAQFLSERQRRLVSNNAGSLAGLLSLSRQEAHFAGSHLLDPQSGTYNLVYIQQYLQDTPVILINWVYRQQGLMIKHGNPLKIQSLADLQNPDVRYINRQRGAGTRVLLDYQLKEMNIDPSIISGYDQEEYTHLGVAAAISSGRADCGLGIPAAAQALDLDFIPLFQERYDLVIPEYVYVSDLLKPVLELAGDSSFRKTVEALPGYNTRHMGQIMSS